PDGRRYVLTTDASAANRGQPGTFVYGSTDGRLIKSFPGSATAAVFSPAGDRLAYATLSDNLGHVYEFSSGVSLPLVGQTKRIQTIRFSSDGQSVVSGGLDNTAQVFDANNGGNPIETLAGHSEPI